LAKNSIKLGGKIFNIFGGKFSNNFWRETLIIFGGKLIIFAGKFSNNFWRENL
jgi:hypothetical protein